MKTVLLSLLAMPAIGCVSVNVYEHRSLPPPQTAAGAPSPEEVWAEASRSIVNMGIYDAATGTRLCWGTATCIAVADVPPESMSFPGKKAYAMLTAAHVSRKSEGELLFMEILERDESGVPSYTTEVKEDEDDAFLVGSSAGLDAALVFVMTDHELPIQPARMVDESASDQLRVGQALYVIGCSIVPQPSFRSGIVSMLMDRKDRAFVAYVGVSEGSSGGGAYNSSGELIGVVIAMYNVFSAVVIPMNSVYDFFREVGFECPSMCVLED